MNCHSSLVASTAVGVVGCSVPSRLQFTTVGLLDVVSFISNEVVAGLEISYGAATESTKSVRTAGPVALPGLLTSPDWTTLRV